MKAIGHILAIVTMLICAERVDALNGTLSDNILIESKHLGYSLQYRVYTPENANELSDLPTLYVTDGQWYISDGKFHEVIDKLITDGKIKPIIAIFVDSGAPGNPRLNRRQKQFFCVYEYVDFFRDELVPQISNSYPASSDRTDRVILGLSFGGLNSACFGLMAPDVFEGIAMQSPAFHPVPQILGLYRDHDRRALDIFFSVGRKNDNTKEARKFRDVLQEKGYRLAYSENRHGHNWKNWRPLLDDIALHYFAQ